MKPRFAFRLSIAIVLVSLLIMMIPVSVVKAEEEDDHTCEVLSGAVTDGREGCLYGVEVRLLSNQASIESKITDELGAYEFYDVPYDTYQLEVVLECHEEVGDTPIFSIIYDAGPVVSAQTDSFEVDNDVEGTYVNFNDGSLTPATGVPKDRLGDLAAMYYHVRQVVDFNKSELGVTLGLDLPIEVHGSVSSKPNNMWYDYDDYGDEFGEVYIGSGMTSYENINRPMNREWHEMFHELMDDTVTIPPIPAGDENHGGYANSSTNDSWTEGWAEFWPCALKRSLDADDWYMYWGTTSFEENWTVWSREGANSREEFAVASLLVDLVDPKNLFESDFIELNNVQLWNIIGTNQLRNMYEVYLALEYAGVGQTNSNASETDEINDLDELFIAHGFYEDDGDKVFEEGETVGYGGITGRFNTPQIPNAYLNIAVTDTSGNPVDGTLTFDIDFTGEWDIYDYSYEVDLHGSNGLVYLEVAPDDVEADIHVRSRDQNGNISDDELVISNIEYWQAVAAAQETNPGYVYEHTFEVDRGEPTVSFSNYAYSIAENVSQSTIYVNLSSPSTQTVTVDYTTGPGKYYPATAAVDYIETSGTLTFNPGEISKSFTLEILDDTITESYTFEMVNLTLSNAVNANFGNWSTAVFYIIDNEPRPLATFSSATYEVNENAGTATITINLSTATEGSFPVWLYVLDNGGTATSEADYTGCNHKLIFYPGETSKSFDISILDDALNEDSEAINLEIFINSTTATKGTPASAVLTINDNDDINTAWITVNPTSGLLTTEAGDTATFTIVLNTQPTADVTIGLSSNDTTEGTVSPANLTFTSTNWSTAQTVTVTGVDDAAADGNVAYTVITGAAASGDTSYSGLDTDDVSVTNNDNDTKSIVATISIEPETLNLSSEDDFTVFIKLPEGFDVRDIVIGTISCEGAMAIKSTVAKGTLIVKFDRQSLTGVPTGDEVTLTVTGQFADGISFSGSDIVRIIGNK